MPELSVETVDLLRRWARGELSLPEGHTPDEARRAFLNRLDAAEFLPTAESRYALALLTADDASVQDFAALPRAAQRFLTSALQAELEKFAQESRGLSPAERRERRLVLTRKCAGIPTLLARVDRVASSLATPIDQFPDAQSDARALADELLAAGTLPPAERAIRRQANLATLSGEVVRWRTAAVQLRDDYSDIAACDPRYVNYLATRPSRRRLRRQRIAEARRNRRGGAAVAKLRRSTFPLLFGAFMLLALPLGWFVESRKPSPPPINPVPMYTVPSAVNRDKVEVAKEIIQRLYEGSQERKQQGLAPQPLPNPNESLSDFERRRQSAFERRHRRERNLKDANRLHILVPDRNGKQE
ncbi:MAG TPA: hypothetical protein VGN12_04220 [Pirellulales bacterium]